MNVEHHACDPKLIARLLSRELSGEEQTALEAHFECCSTCRQTLDEMAAGISWWQDARDFLSGTGPALVADRDSASARAAFHDDLAEHEPLHGHVLKSFLAPTDDPRMLGRVGPYEIAGVIGSGGMGIVLKGFDGALNRYVAIKLLAPRLAASATARRRFAREAQAAAAVMHDNVMAIHSVAESQGLPYFVMPYARGASLEKRIQQTGPLCLEEILRIGLQVAAGLAAAHAQGLVHRDIKPANIMLEEGTERVKITDFGLARAADDASLTRSGVIAGTPQYMSPEQARGEAIDHRTDLFSLGSVLYAMATGRPPFRADTPYGVLRRICETEPRGVREINPSVPAWLGRIIARLHEKDPARRFESAAEVAALLEQCLAHVQQPSSIPLPAVLTERAKPASRRRWAIAAASVGAAAMVLVVLLFAGRARDGERKQPTVDEPSTHAQASDGATRPCARPA
ncbi:MAG: protein kinase domain-containing protein, partial [Pirellulales bacterium]